jgi:hypothetical protein
MKTTKLIALVFVFAFLLATLTLTVNPVVATHQAEPADGNVTPAANPAIGWLGDRIVDGNPPTTPSYYPSIATAGDGSLWVAYEYYNTVYGKYNIKVSRSTDGGVTWALMYTLTSTYNLFLPSIAVDPYNNFVYVVFEREFTLTDHDIHMIRYNATSGTWSYSYYPDDSTFDDYNPAIACEYTYGLYINYLFVTWERHISATDTEIVFAKSVDYGVTWTETTLTTHGAGALTDEPSITYAAGVYVDIAYREYNFSTGLFRIGLLRSITEGGSFVAGAVTSFFTNGVYDPSIVATHGGGMVVCAYEYAYSPTDYDIYYSYSQDNGVTWSTTNAMATSTAMEVNPHLTVDGMGLQSNYVGYVHAMYVKYETVGSRTNGVYYTKANFGAITTWSPAVQIANDNAFVSSGAPNVADRAITTRNNVPVVVWTDQRTGYLGVYDTTWGGLYTIDTSPSGLQLVVDGYVYTAPVAFYWAYNSVHTLSVSSPQGQNSFLRWSDGGTQTHVVTANLPSGGLWQQLIVAYFTPTLTLVLSPSTVARGSPLTISGQLTPGLATTISLYYRTSVNNPWALAATLPTNSGGAYSVTVTVPMSLPTGTYSLVAVWYNPANNRYAVSYVEAETIT